MSSGEIVVVRGVVQSGYVAGWTSPFAVCVGVFTLLCMVTLAAVYLACESAHDDDLQAAFRRRAIACELVLGICAAVVAWRAAIEAPTLFDQLVAGPAAIAVHGAALVAATATLVLLATRRFALARLTVAAQVAAVVIGWGLAMHGDLVHGAVAMHEAGTVATVALPVLWVLAGASLLLGPALWWLMRVFKQSADASRP
jgi:cytochrome bd-type quinol oxidase subunit 2